MSGPECLPLKTWEAVDEWTEGEDEICVSTVPLEVRESRTGDTPQTLLCHDMKGGYQEDRFVQGCDDPDSYRFYHWQYIDMFIYFSHYFVTIPPPTWTNAAHRNGVKMLGTLITEWDDGFKNCEQLLQSEDTYKKFADKLIRINKYYKFDGWLVNIENKIQEEKVQSLCDFVAYLTERIHSEVPGSKVIWYDSVIKTGELKWQDELNEKNCMFFDACDGIFLNYNWKDETLKNSKSAATKKHRAMDVFVGIDVFGRGCLGGGGYNTIEALTEIRKHNMSAAIFAQGWVHETQGSKNFTENENRFWSLLHHLLPHQKVQSVVTSFCQGFGQKYHLQGKVISDQPWHNLNLQELQPTFTDSQFTKDKNMVPYQPIMSLCIEDAYSGGSCLQLDAQLPQDGIPIMFKLFDTCLKLSEPVIISYSFKCKPMDDCDIFLECTVSSAVEKNRRLILRGDKSRQNVGANKESDYILTPLSAIDVKKELNCFHQDSMNAWVTRIFKVDPKIFGNGPAMVESIDVGMFTEATQLNIRQSVLLGQVQIVPVSSLPNTDEVYPDINGIVITPGKQERGSLLSWKCKNYSDIKYFNVFTGRDGKLKLIGHASASSLELCPLPKLSYNADGDNQEFYTIDENNQDIDAETPVNKAPRLCDDKNEAGNINEVYIQCILNNGFVSPIQRFSVQNI